WSNPYGTQISWMAADEVFHFLGAKEKNALHIREGGHDYLSSDWEAVVDFCDIVFFGKEQTTGLITDSFPMQEDGTGLSMWQSRIDWRRERPHYSWRSPV
ncbi:MAG: hypothetical protein ACI4EG_15055, partial [Fusicatenibacter sp.]